MSNSSPEPKLENLYDLCEEVCQSIEASPLNYNQEVWAAPASRFNEEACGTAFCRAGWMCSIIDHQNGKTRTTEEWRTLGLAISTYHTIYMRAKALLSEAGIPYDAISGLFAGAAIEKETCTTAIPKVGSPEYGAVGAAGMRAFMAKWEHKLKAAPLPGPEPE